MRFTDERKYFVSEASAHRVSITMEAAFCVEAVQEALVKHGRPALIHTGRCRRRSRRGSRGLLLDAKIAICMDGKGAWRDNVFVERLWRTVKYEEVYLRDPHLSLIPLARCRRRR